MNDKRNEVPGQTIFNLTRSSSTVVLHFSRFIRFTAHFSFLGLHIALWTTAVAPEPILTNTKLFESIQKTSNISVIKQ